MKANKSQAASVVTKEMVDRSQDIELRIETICLDVAARSAVLEAIAAERTVSELGFELPDDFWRGVRLLMKANRDDLQRLMGGGR
jgi:hypothetical protein